MFSRKALLLAIFIPTILASSLLSNPALGALTSFVKTVSWEFDEEPSSTATGDGFYKLWARGRCKCTGESRDTFGAFDWTLADGLDQSYLLKTQEGCYSATGHISFSALEPEKVEDKWTVAGTIWAMPSATAAVAEDSYAYGRGSGWLRIRTREFTVYKWLPPDVKVEVKTQGKLVQLGASIHADPPLEVATNDDPITVEILEVETGTTISEDLFSFHIHGDGLCDWEWDNTGEGIVLQLHAGQPEGSYLEVAGEALSTWVSPAINFSARLQSDGLTTTGLLSGLPWDLTYEGGDLVGVSLPPEHMPAMEFQYAIPDGLLDPSYTYEESLIMTTDNSVWAENFEGPPNGNGNGNGNGDEPPEPATLTLLALGLVALRRRRGA